MITFIVFALTVLTCSFLVLQVMWPLLINKPTFSWFRHATRLDRVREQYRVAVRDAKAEDVEEDLHDFLDDRIEQITNKQ